jgi:hypothetical protein
VTGKHRVFTLSLRRDGERWHGHIKDNTADSATGDDREAVARVLEQMALAQLAHELRAPGAPLVKEVVFELEQT